MSHIQVVQEIGMTGMLRTGIGGRFIQYNVRVSKKMKLKKVKILWFKIKGYSRGWLYGSMFETNKKIDT